MPYQDRKSTRLNSSHGSISYAVFCLKKKKTSLNSSHGSISYDAFCLNTTNHTRRLLAVVCRAAPSNLVFPLFQLCPLLFFFNDTATTEIYTLSLHDALPISWSLDTTSALKPCGSQGFSNASGLDRKSTRLNSSHGSISYAVFCLKKNILIEILRARDLLVPEKLPDKVGEGPRRRRMELIFFFLRIRRPPSSTLFPYTTLFRPPVDRRRHAATGARPAQARPARAAGPGRA